ncbi:MULTISPECIES: hypothetical protein [Streptomyces]|uniref:Cobyrinic acid a,c-diamide synthase n=1 Tax=Streptomyces qinglanensis TaxID=943816 RepID=A0A1E7K3L4_9ACTN|nr:MULTISPECIES: hypothetical protein [Streptomyces]OEU98436.1 hypothetical protein AN217_12125 [Streptomyces qinglanensis]
MSLPAADELFRTTGGAAVQPSAPQEERSAQVGQANGETPAQPSAGPAAAGPVAPRVPAPASEPVPETGGAQRSAADESGGEPGGARRTPRGARGTATADDQRSAPPQQAGPAPGERTGRRGGAAKGRQPSGASGTASPTASAAPATSRRSRAARRPSGRERHDEKITVYVSAEELMDLEHARLVLRGEHGLAVDRGRIVREAVAVVLADLESRGDASILVRRLRGR